MRKASTVRLDKELKQRLKDNNIQYRDAIEKGYKVIMLEKELKKDIRFKSNDLISFITEITNEVGILKKELQEIKNKGGVD